MNKNMSLNHDREPDNLRGSPRIAVTDYEGPSAKRPKVESNSDGDDLRQVRQNRHHLPTNSRVIINLED